MDRNERRSLTPIRLLIADDHPLVLDGLVRLFEAESDFEIVAIAHDGAAALTAARKYSPSVAVVDIRMPLVSGLEIARAIKLENISTLVVLLTASASEEEKLEAQKVGVRGIVLKEMAPQRLLDAVREVCLGGRWFEEHSTRFAFEGSEVERFESPKARQLTSREKQIIRLVARGLRNREIGDELSIAEGTVKIHLNRIYEKLSVSNRVELTNFARIENLI